MPTRWSRTHGWAAIGLDDVVAVEALGVLEVAERAAAAARAADVDPDVGVAEGGEHVGEAGRRRIARRVAGVLHDGGIRPVLDRPGQPDARRQCRAVARGDVAEPGARELLRGVELGRRCVVARHHLHRAGHGGAEVGIVGPDAHDGPRRYIAEDGSPVGVGRGGAQDTVGADELQGDPRFGAGHRDLLDTGRHREGRKRHRRRWSVRGNGGGRRRDRCRSTPLAPSSQWRRCRCSTVW